MLYNLNIKKDSIPDGVSIYGTRGTKNYIDLIFV